MPRRSEIRIRPLTGEDLPAAAQVAADAFEFVLSDPAVKERWTERLEHLLITDPDGSWVAERDGEVLGVAQAMIRDRLWCLSLLTVAPAAQSSGAGRALMRSALDYGAAVSDGLIVSANDPRALRLYARAGFTLLPTLQCTGTVDRAALPESDATIRELTAAELKSAAPVSRALRGAHHTPELQLVLRQGSRLLALEDRGYLVTGSGHPVWLLAATDEEAARALLVRGLKETPDSASPEIRWITAEQGWAVETLTDAGLGLEAYGALCVRGHPGPLWPYLPSPPFA